MQVIAFVVKNKSIDLKWLVFQSAYEVSCRARTMEVFFIYKNDSPQKLVPPRCFFIEQPRQQ